MSLDADSYMLGVVTGVHALLALDYLWYRFFEKEDE
jgi:hypothetical protein